MIPFSCNSNQQQAKPKAVNVSNDKCYVYPLAIDSLHLQDLYVSARWYIYTKYCDVLYKPKSDTLLGKPFGELELRFDNLDIKNDTVLKKLLEVSNDVVIRLRIATAIFEISQDAEMVDIAVSLGKEMDNKKDAYYVYKLTSAFYYLAKFKNEKTKQLIKEYASHPEYLISYNAKQALEI